MVDHRTLQRLAALAGHGPTRAMLLAAEEIDAETAVRIGLAQRPGDLEAALAWAADIAALAPLSVAGHKLALERLLPPLPEDPEVTSAFRTAWKSADLREGRAAFAERRPAHFEGR
jgi:enoyl-CoA hydratase